MAILHFSGKFKFNVPFYNNIPSHEEIEFNSGVSPTDVQKNFGADPLQYYEFEFIDVYVSKITYDDGTYTTDHKNDPLIGKKVLLKALLVDVAPHLETGRLFAGEVRILDLLMGKLNVAIQSDLVSNIKTDNLENIKNDSVRYSAFFDSHLYDTYKLTNEETIEDSRFINDIEENLSNIKIHFTVNRFIHKFVYSDNTEKLVNEGNVYGYFGETTKLQNIGGIRLSERSLIFNPDLDAKQYLGKMCDFIKCNDLIGTYEIQEGKKLLLLSYVNFIPFIDLNYNTIKGARYFVRLFYDDKEVDYKAEMEIKTDSESFFENGGTKIVKIPEDIKDLSKLSLKIILQQNDKEIVWMIEPEYDMVVDKSNRYVHLESDKQTEITAYIFHKNRLDNKIIPVFLENPIIDPDYNKQASERTKDKSPIVAKWINKDKESEDQDKDKVSNALTVNAINGRLISEIEAINLENSDKVYDPVNDVYLQGELPWNRYYGNTVSLKLLINGKYEIERKIPVRVIHSINLESINNKIRSAEIVKKLFSYYTRYYPWLHSYYIQDPDPQQSRYFYGRFMDLNNQEYNHHNWASTKNIIDNIDKILDRLSRKDDDWRKMPRSRDFPFKGVDFIKAWRTQITDGLIHEVNEYINNGVDEDIKRIDRLIASVNCNEYRNILQRIKRYLNLDNIDENLEEIEDDLKRIEKFVKEIDDENDKDFIKYLKLRILVKVTESIHNLKHNIQSTHIHSH